MSPVAPEADRPELRQPLQLSIAIRRSFQGRILDPHLTTVPSPTSVVIARRTHDATVCRSPQVEIKPAVATWREDADVDGGLRCDVEAADVLIPEVNRCQLIQAGCDELGPERTQVPAS